MSDNDCPKLNNGWTKLYHPRGPLVTLPVPADPVSAFNHINICLDAGWLVEAAGLEQGEHKEGVGYVLRGTQENDGKQTPFLLLYDTDESHGFSFLKVYLNTEANVADFEAASKMKLLKLPEYVGDNKPERGKSSKIDQFIVRVPAPLTVILKSNPKYNEEDRAAAASKQTIYKVPRRLFVRWDGIAEQKPAAPASGQAGQGGPVTPRPTKSEPVKSAPTQAAQKQPDSGAKKTAPAVGPGKDDEAHDQVMKYLPRADTAKNADEWLAYGGKFKRTIVQKAAQQEAHAEAIARLTGKGQPLDDAPLQDGDIPFAWIMPLIGTLIALTSAIA
jgi:hypothetical protein